MTDRIVVYSCYFGAHEPLNPNSMGDGNGYDRVLFTDSADHQIDGVETRVVEDLGLGPAHLSRRPKMCPHIYLPEAEWVIYVDNRANLKVSPEAIVDSVKAEFGEEPNAGRYLFNHNKDCAYREIMACKRRNLIPREVGGALHTLFAQHEFPKNQGLYVNTLMVQKMGSAETDAMNTLWWELFLRYAKRDQITLPFALWKSKVEPMVLPLSNREFINWPVIGLTARKKFRAKHGVD